MRKTLTALVILPLAACSSIDSVFSPGADPAPGDIERSSAFQAKLRELLAQGEDARFARISREKLVSWESRTIAITKETYEGKATYGKYGLPVGLPEDLFGIKCKYELERPFVYLNYNVKGRYLQAQRPEATSTFSEGSCSELKQSRNSVMVSTYGFTVRLSSQVPSNEWGQRLESALAWPGSSSFGTTDRRITQLPNAVIGEAAGYTYEHIPTILHASREKKTGNYYRLIVVGDRTVVSAITYGPRTQSVQDMQAVVWSVLESLTWSK